MTTVDGCGVDLIRRNELFTFVLVTRLCETLNSIIQNLMSPKLGEKKRSVLTLGSYQTKSRPPAYIVYKFEKTSIRLL